MKAAESAALVFGLGIAANAAAVVLAYRQKKTGRLIVNGVCLALCIALTAVAFALIGR